MAKSGTTLSDIFRHSWRDIRVHWKTTFGMVWLPALGMSVVGVLLNYFWGQNFSLFITGFLTGDATGGSGFPALTLQALLFGIISMGASFLAQGVVGSSWLLWLDDCKKNGYRQNKSSKGDDIEWSYHRWRHPVYKRFLVAWVLLSLVGSGVIVVVVLLWGFWFSGGGVSGVVVGMLLGVPVSSYVLGRCSMVLPLSLRAVPRTRFKESWQQTSSFGGELTGLFFVAWYLLPLFLLVPSQILQGLLGALGLGDMMVKALLVSFVSNSFVLMAVLFLVGGLSYLYDRWFTSAPKGDPLEGGNYG